jgi:hypothetical protein
MLIISPAIALKSELLPTLGLPIIATTGNAILSQIKNYISNRWDYNRNTGLFKQLMSWLPFVVFEV